MRRQKKQNVRISITWWVCGLLSVAACYILLTFFRMEQVPSLGTSALSYISNISTPAPFFSDCISLPSSRAGVPTLAPACISKAEQAISSGISAHLPIKLNSASELNLTPALLSSEHKPERDRRWVFGGFNPSKETATFEVTAYCPCELCCGKWADGYTASGHKINKRDKFVAAPEWIPFGTLLVVVGYNGGRPVPVLDRGSAIKGNRLDVYFDTHQQALEWGIRNCNIEVQK